MMEKISEEILFQGEWLRVKRSHFKNNRGEEYSWEHLDRTRAPHAVVILATLRPSGKKVFIRQFRPGVEGFVIGLPAGLSESPTIEEDAHRELLEETGYIGTITTISPKLYTMPALSSNSIQFIEMDVDETLPQNQSPQQELEPGEEIEVFLVAPDKTDAFFTERQKEGDFLVSGLWYLFKQVH
jgi:8-oxo-dGTP pyrophosphatase MutT (NUDIX family)